MCARVGDTNVNDRVQIRIIFSGLAASGIVGPQDIVVAEMLRYTHDMLGIGVGISRARGGSRGRFLGYWWVLLVGVGFNPNNMSVAVRQGVR